MTEETYKIINSVIEREYDLSLTDDEIDAIVKIANRAKADAEHVGIRPERCEHNPREAAFKNHWLKENKSVAGVNYGNGTLQGLFSTSDGVMGNFTKVDLEITKREKMIVATVIQWLGSNVGFCFLEETLKDCGYKIVPVK